MDLIVNALNNDARCARQCYAGSHEPLIVAHEMLIQPATVWVIGWRRRWHDYVYVHMIASRSGHRTSVGSANEQNIRTLINFEFAKEFVCALLNRRL